MANCYKDRSMLVAEVIARAKWRKYQKNGIYFKQRDHSTKVCTKANFNELLFLHKNKLFSLFSV